MKVILSRKGFDSGFGGIASPILPDGTLLSMPIPTDDVINYNDLSYKGKKYSDILKELKPTFKYKTCHLDPDIRKDWRLENIIGFLYLVSLMQHWIIWIIMLMKVIYSYTLGGLDKLNMIEMVSWDSSRGASDLQVIYGYLQVGKVCRTGDKIKKVSWHPHADARRENLKYNAIYIANNKLLDTKLEGYGVFDFSKDLVLTKEGETRSKWQLPACLVDKEISYHSLSNYKDGYFQSAKRGQEFVVDADDAIIDWIKKLIIKHKA